MNTQMRHSHMSPELPARFFEVFSRMEYALRECGYVIKQRDHVTADWHKFGDDINERFCAVTKEDFCQAMQYLLGHPPRIQTQGDDGKLTFIDQPINTEWTKARRILKMVCRVRNTLFHGGKYQPDGEQEEGRNETLVSCSLVILNHSVIMSDGVRESYEA